MSLRAATERWLARLLRPVGIPGAILCYHGVAAPGTSPRSALHVTVEEFRATIEFVRDVAEVVPLADLLKRRRQGSSTSGQVAVTFDDAYRSLLLPGILDISGGCPATVFVAPGLLGTRPWWDRLDEAWAACSDEVWVQFENDLGVTNTDRGPKAAYYGPVGAIRHRLLTHHSGRWPASAERPLRELETALGIAGEQVVMTWEEVGALSRMNGVTVGVHTLTHPALPRLPDDEIIREISSCHSLLHERLDRVLPILAVPYGLYDARVLRQSRQVGMDSTLSLEGWTLRRGEREHGVPRICVVHGDPPARQRLRLAGVKEWLPGG